MTRIYLDCAAGAPLRPEAAAAMKRAAATAGNPSSLHAIGRQARRELELAATEVRRRVGAPRVDVVFTGSGSEANDLGIIGVARARVRATQRDGGSRRCRVLLGPDESPSARAAAERLRREGFSVEPLLNAHLHDDVALIVVGCEEASSGRKQPTADIARAAERYGIAVHVDAARVASVAAIDFMASGATTMAFASETLGGPRGAGALVKLKGTEVTALWHGGGQEDGVRSGSQAVLPIAGFAAALAAPPASALDLDSLWQPLGLEVIGGHRYANVSTARLSPALADTLVRLASAQGVMLGLTPLGVRASAGWSTRPEDVEAATKALARCAPDLQKALQK